MTMATFTYFGNGSVRSVLFLCFLITSQKAGSCDPLTTDESKVGLIKIELTRSGNTIITIGNLWKLGHFIDSGASDSVSGVIPVSARATSAPNPMYARANMIERARPYHTSQVPVSPPPTVTTRKFMQSYDVTQHKINNPNKRHLDSSAPNFVSPQNTRYEPMSLDEKLKNIAKDDFIYKYSPKAEATTAPTTNDENNPEVTRNEMQPINNLQNDATSTAAIASETTYSGQLNDQTGPTTSQSAGEEVSTTPTAANGDEMDVIDSERLLMKDRLRRIVDNHYSWSILNAEDADCGESNTDRIIGGVEASLGQFPWIARLGYTVLPEVNITEYRCGGVLIGQQFVLTAAHCVSNLGPRTSMSRVRLGEHDIKTTKDCLNNVCAEPVQDFRPVNISAHAEFMKRKYGNDIAIIKLDRPAIYNGWVSPICLPKGETLKASYTGESANVAGWGIMNMDTQEMADRLQTVALPILNLDDCQREYKKKVLLTEEQICAGNISNKDACGGDSGGPLMKVATENGSPQYFLLGVVSFGPSDCGKKEPGVYANVSYHMPWILDKVEKLSI